MARLELTDVAVRRGGRRLLDAVDLTVDDGERVAILGASGAGKTTLLRAIAGLELFDEGRIELDGVGVDELDETERGIALVTQAGSLLPNRSVSGNIGFPLELLRLRRPEVERRVRAQARAFSIGGLLRRRSTTLSAGESAEVSLARGLVRPARLLLLDEPFGGVGHPPPASLIRDVVETQTSHGSSLLLATNDPRTAARVAVRIAVLAGGTCVQVATYTELLARPATLEVAWLVGDEVLNVLPGRLVDREGVTVVRAGELDLPTWDPSLRDQLPRPVQLAIRPSDLHLGAHADEPSIRGRVVRHAFLGSEVEISVTTEDLQLLVRCGRPAPRVGTLVEIGVPNHAVHLFDPGGSALVHGI